MSPSRKVQASNSRRCARGSVPKMAIAELLTTHAKRQPFLMRGYISHRSSSTYTRLRVATYRLTQVIAMFWFQSYLNPDPADTNCQSAADSDATYSQTGMSSINVTPLTRRQVDAIGLHLLASAYADPAAETPRNQASQDAMCSFWPPVFFQLEWLWFTRSSEPALKPIE